jgi:hypothetical protein
LKTVSRKTIGHELHKSNIRSKAAIAKPLIIERIIIDGVTTIKPGHQTTEYADLIWSGKSSFTLFLTSARVYVWGISREAYNSECLVPTVKHEERALMVWVAISW